VKLAIVRRHHELQVCSSLMQQRRLFPELVVALASAAWGLFWIPLRAIERQGLDPGWATLTQFLAPLALLTPFAAVRYLRRHPTGVRQYQTGVLIGAAVAMYLESLLLTDVARALILFYAMPAWGTLLEVGVMRRPLTRWRIVSLFLSLAGMLTILGAGESLALAMNLGDLMALLSGIFFAFGAMLVRQAPERSVFEELFAFFFYGSLAALVLSMLPLVELGQSPSLERLIALIPWLVVIAIGFLIPVMSGVYWGSQHVDPGRLGILLQIEAVVGIGSAALLAAEPFGLSQAIGAVLVISAGLVEVLRNQQSTSINTDLPSSQRSSGE
jgi:drug/metabolite transporter (DMT)-like permease